MTAALCTACQAEIKSEDYAVSKLGLLCTVCAAAKQEAAEDRGELIRLARTCFLTAAFSAFAVDLLLVAGFSLLTAGRFVVRYRRKAARAQGAPKLAWYTWGGLIGGTLLAFNSLANQVSQLRLLVQLFGA